MEPTQDNLLKALQLAVDANDIAAANEIAATLDTMMPQETTEEQDSGFLGLNNDFTRGVTGGLADAGLSVMSGLNRAAAGVADLPVDLFNLAATNLGGTAVPRPSELVSSGIEAVTGRPDVIKEAGSYKGQNWASRLLGTVSEYAGFGGGAAKGVQLGAEALRKGMRPTQVGVTSTAERVAGTQGLAASEAKLGALAGIGGGVAREVTDNPWVEMGAAITSAAGAQLIGKSGATLLQPFKDALSHEGVERAVASSLQETAEDLPTAIENLRNNRLVQQELLGEGANVNPAQLTEDASLVASFNALASSDSALLNILNKSRFETERLAVELLEKTVPKKGASGEKVATVAAKEAADQQQVIDEATQALTARLEDEIALANNLLAKAELEAAEVAGRGGAEISQDFVKSLREGLDNAVETSRQIWKAVDSTETLDPTALIKSLTQLRGTFNARPVKKSDIPTEEIKTANKLAKNPSFEALAEYRSTISSAIRETTSAKKKAMLNEILDSVDSFLGAYPSQNSSLLAARNYTRLLKSTYDEGKIGRFLQTNKQGALRIDPETALAKLIGSGGDNIGDVRRAILLETGSGELPKAEGLSAAITEYLRTKFAGATNKAAFVKKYEQTLNLFPSLARQLGNISEEISVAAQALARAEGRRATPLDTETAKVFALLGKDPDRLFASLNQATRDDIKNVASVMSREGAEQGFQAVYLDEFIRLLIKNVDNGSVTSDSLLSNLLRDNKTLNIGFTEVLTDAQRKALRNFEKTFQLLAPPRSSGNTRPVRDVVSPNALVDTIGKLISVSAGSRLAPSNVGALQTASQSASFTSKILGRLTKDQALQVLRKAAVDPNYLDFLLSLTPKTIDKNRAKLNTYLLSAGVPLRQPPTEQEQ